MKNFETEMDDAEYTIDLTALLSNMLLGLKKFGWILIILAMITSSIACLNLKQTYSPYYTASATFTVSLNMESSDSIYEDSLRASQMSTTFPYILTSSVLKNIIIEDLGLDDITEDITAENVEGTNLFTIKVTSGDEMRAYEVLQSVIKNYPTVAETVIGSTHLDMIEETGIPKKPDNQLDYIWAVKIGVLPGIIIGLIIILLFAFTRKTILKIDDLNDLTNIKQIGLLPRVTFKKRGKNSINQITLHNAKLPPVYFENIYKVRTRIEKLMNKNNYKTVLVTSAIPGEGKSTVAFNLALALAEEGKKTILIDCDLRRPSLLKMLPKGEDYISIDKVLNGEAELNDAIRYLDKFKMSVLVCAHSLKDSSEIIGTPKLSDIMTELKEEYDYIIIDTAPTAILSDTSELAKYVDGAVFVVKQDFAKVNHILNALEHLTESSNIDILGYVINSVKAGLGDYGYGGYGYGYGKYGSYGKYGGYGKKKRDKGEQEVLQEVAIEAANSVTHELARDVSDEAEGGSIEEFQEPAATLE